ncbi:putative aldo/keto reductase [Astrocystis sublimbata]|nr:putative aldo/keto reductase [Astrocystis sublimbata]
MSSTEAPQLIFGCGGLGNEFLGVNAVTNLLQTLKKGGLARVDTAALYPPTDIGASQRLLGQVGASQMGFAIDTKVLISIRMLRDTLTPEKIEKSVAISYQDLNLKDGQRIDILYAHAPDVTTPLEDQAKGFDAQYRKGMFNKLGLCNFPAAMLAEYITICEREGYVKPSVYQGLYNVIDRRHEGAVLDVVRKHGMNFVAHSPLGSGFLPGNLTFGHVEGTRFAEGNMMSMDGRRYDTDKHHEAVRSLDKMLEPHSIPKTDVALRWLAFHSKLRPGDAIIFGASKMAQVEQNLAAVKKGALPGDIVTELDRIWEELASK